MKEILDLAQDAYLWAGVAGLILAVVGVRWVLRSLHSPANEPEPMIETGTAFQSGIFGPTPVRSAEPAAEPEPPAVRTVRAAKPPEASVEVLAQRLDRVEQTLSQILQKLGQPGAKPAQGSEAQIQQIAVKIDKIYQVLAQISSEEAKP